MTGGFADFYEAVRKGNAVAIVSNASSSRITVAPLWRDQIHHEWAVPSFDFGHVLDPHSPSTFIGEQAWKEMWPDVMDLLTGESFRLPFDECVYLVRYRETPQKWETVNLLHLWHDEDGTIAGNTYFQQDASQPVMRRWTLMPFQFVVHQGDNTGVEFNFDPRANLSPDVEAEYVLDMRTKYSEALVLTLLLRSNGIVIEEPELSRTAEVNRGRASAKLPPLSRTRVIRFGHLKRATSTVSGIGSPKRPHERRGHYRKLRTGKVVPIAASKVHGGADAPSYVVTGASPALRK